MFATNAHDALGDATIAVSSILQRMKLTVPEKTLLTPQEYLARERQVAGAAAQRMPQCVGVSTSRWQLSPGKLVRQPPGSSRCAPICARTGRFNGRIPRFTRGARLPSCLIMARDALFRPKTNMAILDHVYGSCPKSRPSASASDL